MTSPTSLRSSSLATRWTFVAALLAGFAACGGSTFTSEGGDGDSAGDGDSGDGDAGDGDAGDGDIGDGDGDIGDGDIGDGDVGDGDVGDGDMGGDGDIGMGIRDCEATIHCVLAKAACCEACGMPLLNNVTGIRVGQEAAHDREVCGDSPSPCPECASGPPNPNLFATCVQGQCEAQDLARHPASECTSSDECVLTPAACCECGAGNGPSEIVALNRNEAHLYRESQCASVSQGGPVACADCEWIPPENLRAECISGRCSVQ